MDFSILKDWRIILVIVFVLGSLIAIGPSLQGGVVVKYVDSDSPFYGKISTGESLTWANEKDIKSVEDWYRFEDYTGVLRVMHNGQLELADVDGGTGIEVEKRPISRLNLGMDLMGGTRVMLKPQGNVSPELMQQTISTLETRINVYGLRESMVQEITDVAGNRYIQIEMAGGSRQEVEDLISRQGKFEGKISRIVELDNNEGILNVGGESYTIKVQGNDIIFNGKEIGVNESFEIDSINFEYVNKTSEAVLLLANIFTGLDIKQVCMQDIGETCVSRVVPTQGGYEFMFQIYVSPESAEKFSKVTQGMKVIVEPASGRSYLDGKIVLFLDENLITELSIVSDLQGQAVDNPLITGGRETEEDAVKEKLFLQSILQSGEMPTKLETVKIDQISASLGQEFMKATLLAGIVAAIAVSIVIFVRYRKLKILIPMMLWDIFEIIIILGIAATLRNWWTIDLASIAGIIAAIGYGTNDQVMIIDEIILGGAEEKKLYTLKQRVKKAFFIIFGAAATVVVAMMPLLFIGIGVMKGFAISTVVALFIGVVITRPAFGKLAEKMLQKEEISG